MTANFSTPILASSLPRNFRKIRLELAREREHPDGDWRQAYILIAPLDADSKIDQLTWKQNRAASRVVRQRPGESDCSGHLIRSRGGAWVLHYDEHGAHQDEKGYRFATEAFVVGEYVSITDDESVHVYKVVSVERL